MTLTPSDTLGRSANREPDSAWQTRTLHPVRARVTFHKDGKDHEIETSFIVLPRNEELIETGLDLLIVESVVHHPGVHDGVAADIRCTPIRDMP